MHVNLRLVEIGLRAASRINRDKCQPSAAVTQMESGSRSYPPRLTSCIERALDRHGVVGCAGYRALKNEKRTSNERGMVPPTGFEPATDRVETGCAIRCATGASRTTTIYTARESLPQRICTTCAARTGRLVSRPAGQTPPADRRSPYFGVKERRRATDARQSGPAAPEAD